LDLLNGIKHSEFSIIEGENKAGKLTFSLFILNKIESKNPLIISSMNKQIIKKRFDNLKTIQNENFPKFLQTIKLFSLKNNWLNLKASYGFDLLIEDLNKLINDMSPDAIILHRPDLMFSEIESELAKFFIENIINIKNNLNFKLILTSDIKSEISDFSENYADIAFFVKKENNTRKIIIIKNSIFPLEDYEYTFSLKDLSLNKIQHDNDNNTSTSITNNTNTKPKMLIISNDKYFMDLHQYLFEKYFDLTFASSTGEIINEIMENPNIIVYQTENEKPDTTLCSLVKENKINSKIIYFVNKEFVRIEDKMEINTLGCYEILPKNFHIEEYILLVERAINNFFYTQKIKKLPAFKEVQKLKKLEDISENFYEERIYFSVIRINKKIDDIKYKLRAYDILYVAENYTCIIMINITKNFFKKRLKEKFNIPDLEIIEALDWRKNKDFCK
jgi:hypothetical protein